MANMASIKTAVEERYRARTRGSATLFERAQRTLPGGDTRSALYFPPYPTYMARGNGPRLYDVDGNDYLDLLNNYTSLVHGHAHPAIVAAICEQAARGTAHGAPIELQVTLAEKMCARVKSLERIRFANSGTEAVLNAIRAARAFSGRPKILKMEGGYHGTYDAAEVSVDPGRAAPSWPEGRPEGPGLSPGLVSEVLIAPYNDLERAGEIISRHRHELAAVIIEPVMGATGMIPADGDFLRGLREVTLANDVLLIFDEVISFRLSTGGVQEIHRVRPDLTTFGKLIGGGLAVGGFGGRADILDQFDPRRSGYIPQSGTFNGNAATLAAGLVALDLLTPQAIERINRQGDWLRQQLQASLDDLGIAGDVTGSGSLMHVHLTEGPVRDYRTAALGRRSGIWRWLHLALLNRGVMVAPRGMFIVSTPMTDQDLQFAVAQFRAALAEVAPLFDEASVGATA